MYISRERWKRKEKNARYVFRVRMRDVSVRKISRRRDIWEENCVKGEEEEHRIETARSLLFVGIRLRKLHLLRGGKDQGGNKVAGRSAGRIRGNPCRTKFAIERSSRWRFMSCRDRLLVTPWIVDGYPCGKPHTLATIPEQQWAVEVEIEKLFCVIRDCVSDSRDRCFVLLSKRTEIQEFRKSFESQNHSNFVQTWEIANSESRSFESRQLEMALNPTNSSYLCNNDT